MIVNAWVSDYTLNLVETRMLQNIFRYVHALKTSHGVLRTIGNLICSVFLLSKLQLLTLLEILQSLDYVN